MFLNPVCENIARPDKDEEVEVHIVTNCSYFGDILRG